jgi:hypothetical protein
LVAATSGGQLIHQMKKIALAALVLLGSVEVGFGQGRDTAFAVHKLFAQRRRGGQSLAGTSGDLAQQGLEKT